jgi:hypothetical protein
MPAVSENTTLDLATVEQMGDEIAARPRTRQVLIFVITEPRSTDKDQRGDVTSYFTSNTDAYTTGCRRGMAQFIRQHILNWCLR